MKGLLNWQAIRELKFAPMTRDGAGGSAVDWDKVAVMYNGMAELKAYPRLMRLEKCLNFASKMPKTPT